MRLLHIVKYHPWRPKWLIRTFRERRLTLERGYSTFVLDEFDYHFNEMAIASLRFHLSEDCVANNEEHREKWEALIERLSEPEPEIWDNADEQELIQSAPLFGPQVVSPEVRTLFERYRAREDDWLGRKQAARKNFVDQLPYLWS